MNKRICPAHLRGKPVGRSYHDGGTPTADYPLVGEKPHEHFIPETTAERIRRRLGLDQPNPILQNIPIIEIPFDEPLTYKPEVELSPIKWSEPKNYYGKGGSVSARVSHLVPNPGGLPRHIEERPKPTELEFVIERGDGSPPKSSEPPRDMHALARALFAGRDIEDAKLIAEIYCFGGIDLNWLIEKPFDELMKLREEKKSLRAAMEKHYFNRPLVRWVPETGGQPLPTDDKTIETCRTHYDNVMNFRYSGQPDPIEPVREFFEATKGQEGFRFKDWTTYPPTDAKKGITRAEFNDVVEAVWSEIEYQNNLPRRTADEAKDCAGFATLGRAYLRKLEDNWYSQPGEHQPEGNVAVTACLHDLRKLAAIFVRAMIYCGIRSRS